MWVGEGPVQESVSPEFKSCLLVIGRAAFGMLLDLHGDVSLLWLFWKLEKIRHAKYLTWSDSQIGPNSVPLYFSDTWSFNHSFWWSNTFQWPSYQLFSKHELFLSPDCPLSLSPLSSHSPFPPLPAPPLFKQFQHIPLFSCLSFYPCDSSIKPSINFKTAVIYGQRGILIIKMGTAMHTSL